MMNCGAHSERISKIRLNESGERREGEISSQTAAKFLFTFVVPACGSPLKIELKYLRRQLHVFKFVWILNIIDSESKIVTQAATSHRVFDSPRTTAANANNCSNSQFWIDDVLLCCVVCWMRQRDLDAVGGERNFL